MNNVQETSLALMRNYLNNVSDDDFLADYLEAEDCRATDTFDMVEFECPSCNKKSYIQGHFKYSFCMQFSCDNCGTDVELDDSQVEVTVYAKFTNLKFLKVSNTYNYNEEKN